MMRNAFDAVPKEFEEAARIDGARDLKLLVRVLQIDRIGSGTMTIEPPCASVALTGVRKSFGSLDVLLQATWTDQGRIRIGGSELEAPALQANFAASATVTFGIRPEHLQLSETCGQGLPAIVEFSEYLGSTRYVYCKLADGQTATIEHRTDFAPRNGSTVTLSMTAGKCFVFDDQGMRLR